MLSELTRGEFLSQSSRKEVQEVLVQDIIEIVIGTETLEGEVEAGAEIGLIGIGIVGGIEITIVEAGATVEVPITTKMMVKRGMMMRGGAEAGAEAVHMEVPHLVEVVPVLGEAPHQEYLLRVKALLDVLVRSALQLQGVLHHGHANEQLIPVVNLLANLRRRSKCGSM